MTDLPPPPPPLPSSPPTSAADLPQAGAGALARIGQRGLARVLDLIIVSIPVEIWMFAAGYVKTDGGKVALDPPAWFAAATVALPIVYEFLLIGWRGQTVGKMAMRIRVARFADGGRPTWQQSGARVLVPAVPQVLGLVLPAAAGSLGVLLWVAWIGVYLSAAVDPLARGLHDKAAATLVLRTR